MRPHPKLLRFAAVLSSVSLVAVYIGCRAANSAASPAKTDGTQTEVFSGSKSEVIAPKTEEVFVGSKSAAVFPTTAVPPPPPGQRASAPKQQPK